MTDEKKQEWKIGDWCFCEFELKQIMEMEDGRVCGVSDGFLRHGSWDLSDRLFPLDLKIKIISDQYREYHDRWHREYKKIMNWPDLNAWLVSEWVATCQRFEDVEFVKSQYDRLREMEEYIREHHNKRYEKFGIFVF